VDAGPTMTGRSSFLASHMPKRKFRDDPKNPASGRNSRIQIFSRNQGRHVDHRKKDNKKISTKKRRGLEGEGAEEAVKSPCLTEHAAIRRRGGVGKREFPRCRRPRFFPEEKEYGSRSPTGEETKPGIEALLRGEARGKFSLRKDQDTRKDFGGGAFRGGRFSYFIQGKSGRTEAVLLIETRGQNGGSSSKKETRAKKRRGLSYAAKEKTRRFSGCPRVKEGGLHAGRKSALKGGKGGPSVRLSRNFSLLLRRMSLSKDFTGEMARRPPFSGKRARKSYSLEGTLKEKLKKKTTTHVGGGRDIWGREESRMKKTVPASREKGKCPRKRR